MTKTRQRERLRRRKAIFGGDGRHLYKYADDDALAIRPGPRFLELVAKVEELAGGRELEAMPKAERVAILGRAFEALGIEAGPD